MSKVDYNSASYSKFRPTYPEKVFSLLYDYHRGSFDTALDVATGTGQVAVELANKFRHVEASDTLPEMIENATPKDNVTYSVGTAEDLAYEDNSMDVITVATAFHYFDHAAFFKEAKRVLKPNGTLAVWGYFYPTIKDNEEAANVLKSVTSEGPLMSYLDSRVKYIINMYRDIEFPFSDVKWFISPKSADVTHISQPVDQSFMEKTMTLEEFSNYMKTSSAYVKYKKEHPSEDPMDEGINRIREILKLSSNQDTVHAEWPFVLVLCRNTA
ncbi:S-adenosyl-L-methionine-dependent methyltransferase [Radiomyces spectabilis]|uniref:S-adenosyl-L-methionine-dependent methyltransferase n=1 Tax=Radiomyces spectabilis TaxID=64574 RepID=UPI00221F1754|nr:S-adenosyl-L-methionine-dependent methyltransferase [Radiomyces spectabilis]KAI8384743.1 S-adenosyl-L-methionine-dependent methyltransferase [Radiomyces spectabilis]